MEKSRRRFLRNSSLTIFTSGLLGGSKLTAHSKTSGMDCDPTTLDLYGEGPFYTENPPMLSNYLLAREDEPGTRMIISGRVLNLDCNEFIPNTIVDVWHADASGAYDNDAYNLRGYVISNAEGFYMFETVYPGNYLNGNQFRPAHIHFKITPPDFPTLITQLYFEGDENIPIDAAASQTEGNFDASNRIIPLIENSEGVLEGNFDISINGQGIVGTADLHVDKGIIYSAGPNPFVDEIKINYGVFNSARTGIAVHDSTGRQVAVLADEYLGSGKYEAIWQPESNLPSGHYFISLRINDLQVHYQKVFKR